MLLATEVTKTHRRQDFTVFRAQRPNIASAVRACTHCVAHVSDDSSLPAMASSSNRSDLEGLPLFLVGI